MEKVLDFNAAKLAKETKAQASSSKKETEPQADGEKKEYKIWAISKIDPNVSIAMKVMAESEEAAKAQIPSMYRFEKFIIEDEIDRIRQKVARIKAEYAAAHPELQKEDD